MRRVTTLDSVPFDEITDHLELVFPVSIVEAFEGVSLETAHPAWALARPERWERLRPAVRARYGEEWTGVRAAVIGEDHDGNLVCLAEDRNEVGPAVYLLDHETRGLVPSIHTHRVELSNISQTVLTPALCLRRHAHLHAPTELIPRLHHAAVDEGARVVNRLMVRKLFVHFRNDSARRSVAGGTALREEEQRLLSVFVNALVP